jgi:hypothetical protein
MDKVATPGCEKPLRARQLGQLASLRAMLMRRSRARCAMLRPRATSRPRVAHEALGRLPSEQSAGAVVDLNAEREPRR